MTISENGKTPFSYTFSPFQVLGIFAFEKSLTFLAFWQGHSKYKNIYMYIFIPLFPSVLKAAGARWRYNWGGCGFLCGLWSFARCPWSHGCLEALEEEEEKIILKSCKAVLSCQNVSPLSNRPFVAKMQDFWNTVHKNWWRVLENATLLYKCTHKFAAKLFQCFFTVSYKRTMYLIFICRIHWHIYENGLFCQLNCS